MHTYSNGLVRALGIGKVIRNHATKKLEFYDLNGDIVAKLAPTEVWRLTDDLCSMADNVNAEN